MNEVLNSGLVDPLVTCAVASSSHICQRHCQDAGQARGDCVSRRLLTITTSPVRIGDRVTPTVTRVLRLACVVPLLGLIVWLYGRPPRTMVGVTGGVTAAVDA
jgi:hypothetical protein